MSGDGERLFVAGTAPEAPTNAAIYVVRTENLGGFWIPIESANGVVAHPSGEPLYLWGPRVVRIMDPSTLRVTGSFAIDNNGVTSAAITPDGRKFYVTHHFPTGVVGVVNIETGTVSARIPVGENPRDIAIGPAIAGTPIASRSPTPVPTVSVCDGDCNADSIVTVDEILTMVNIALGNLQLATCPVADKNGDGRITVDEIQRALTLAIQGCG